MHSFLQLKSFFSHSSWRHVLCIAGVGLLAPSFALGDALPNRPIVEELSQISYNDQEVIEAAQTMSANDVKYLCYLMARLNRPRAAEVLAEMVFVETPDDKNTLLALASMYIQRKDKERSLKIAKRLYKIYPNDDQVLYFLAASYYLAGQYLEANALYRAIKTDFYKGERFPYEIDLAASANQSGDWFRAMQAYQELLRHHDLNDQLRQPVRNALDEIYRERMDRLQIHPGVIYQEDAWTVVTRSELSRQLSDRTRTTLLSDHQYTEIEGLSGVSADDSERGGAALRFDHDWSRLWSGSAAVGVRYGRSADLMGKLSMTRTFDPLRSLELGYRYNEAARDSIYLEHLDGRQHRAYLRFEDTWQDSMPVSLEFSAREVELNDGYELGSGYNATWSIGKRLRLVNPGLTLSYIGYWQTFSFDSFGNGAVTPLAAPGSSFAERASLWSNLTSERIHNQGLDLRIFDRFWRAWRYEANVAAFYAFEQDSIELSGGVRLDYYLRKSIRLFTGVNYSTSTFNRTSGGSRWEWNSGLTLWF